MRNLVRVTFQLLVLCAALAPVIFLFTAIRIALFN
jgi:hypothetical protein